MIRLKRALRVSPQWPLLPPCRAWGAFSRSGNMNIARGDKRARAKIIFANPCCRGIVGVARSGGMAERFNAPVLKTEMAPRRIITSLVN
jgi:hypothetical protein